MWLLALLFAAFVGVWVFLDARDKGFSLRASVLWGFTDILAPGLLALPYNLAERIIGRFVQPGEVVAPSDAAVWVWGLGALVGCVIKLLIYVYIQHSQVLYEPKQSIRQKNNVVVFLLCVFGLFIVNEMIQQGGGLLTPAYSIFLGLLLVNVPFLLAGVLLSTIIRRWLSADAVGRAFGKGPGVWIGPLLGGLILPVGQCGAAPIARRLMLKGASPRCGILTIAFFPVLNSLLLYRMYRLIGLDTPLIYGAICFGIVSGIVAALLVPISFKNEMMAETGGFDEEEAPGFGGFCHNAITEFIEYGKYLTVGAFVASLLAVFIPNDSIIGWATNASTQTGSAMLKGLLSPVTYLSLPPMARYLEPAYTKWATLSVFVVFGAALSIPHLSVVYGALKARAAGLYAAVFALCLFACGTIATITAAWLATGAAR